MLPDRILCQYEAAKKNTNAVSKAVGYAAWHQVATYINTITTIHKNIAKIYE
jgi:hypothetical protein